MDRNGCHDGAFWPDLALVYKAGTLSNLSRPQRWTDTFSPGSCKPLLGFYQRQEVGKTSHLSVLSLTSHRGAVPCCEAAPRTRAALRLGEKGEMIHMCECTGPKPGLLRFLPQSFHFTMAHPAPSSSCTQMHPPPSLSNAAPIVLAWQF